MNDEICDCGTQSHMAEPVLVTPNWEMIEFIEEENKRIKDLRDATKRDWQLIT